MKRIALLLFLAFLYGCEKIDQDTPVKDDTAIDAELPDNGEADFKLPEIIFASISENDGQDEEGQNDDKPQTRTFVGEDGHKVLWHHGDDVSFFAAKDHNVRYTYEGADGADKVELVKDPDESGVRGNMINKSLAVYPYNENISVVTEDGLDKINLTYPTTQKYGVNSFGKEANIMVAAGQHTQDYSFHFRNAGGYLVIKLYSKGTGGSALHIKDITLSALNGKDKISGSAVIVASKYNAPEITMGEDASAYVTLDCSNDGAGVALGADADHATEFWFCLPPVTFNDGMNITITDVYGNTYTKQTRKTIDIVRNEVQPMAALEIVSQAPVATKLWYTRSDGKTSPVEFYDDMKNPFDAQIIRHEWDSSKGMMVIEFAGPLTTIQAYAFRDTEIATIVLGEGITTVEKEAFRNTPLKEITIPGSVTTIGVDAFYDCDKLASVTFLPSLTKTPLKIGHTISTFGAEYGAFFYTRLTDINLDRELVYIDKNGQNFTPDEWDEGMFAHEYYDEVNSVTVTLGPQVETLMNYMFNYLPVQNITIPGTLKRIGNCVFDGCTALRTLTYESSPTAEPLSHGFNDDSYDEGPFIDSPLTAVTLNREILYTYPVDYLDEASEGLFGDKPTLTSLTLGSDVRILSGYMFANSGITSIDLKNVTHIHNGALMGTRITEISLPASVTHLGDYAFADSALESIDLNQAISIGKGTLRGARFKSITIPASVTSIGDYAFQNCRSLASLTFASGPSDLTIGFQPGTAEYGPFYQSPLTEIIVNRSLVLSEDYADACDSSNEGIFSTEHNMQNTTISLGGQVGKIPEFMFGSLPLRSITIPATVTEISNDAFTDCNKLSSITFESSATPLTVGYNTAGDDEGLFAESPLVSVVLDREIKYTFPSPDDPTEGLFGNKPALTSITIGDNVKTLSGYMFADAGVTSFNLNKVTTIGNGALMGIKFTDITIPAGVTSIGDYAFQNCTSLTDLTLADGESDLTIGFQPGTAQYGPFYQSPLTEIIVNRSLVLSEAYADACDSSNEGVFSTQHDMQNTSILLGGQVGKIPEFMFGCLPLTSITIPGTVTEISNDAFTDCNKLKSIIFEESATPLTVGYNTAGDDDGLFVESPLEKVVLNREVIYTFPDPDSPTEGLFGGKPSLTDITIGDNVKTLSGYMFANAGVTSFNLNKVTTIGNGALMGIKFADITIPASVTSIGDYAFLNCTALTKLTFADGSSDLTIGFQPGTAEYGPFYQSPLTEIIVNRSLVLSKAYADACDSSNEGVFSTEHNMQSATISLGGQVGKIPEFMFGCLPITSITIPSSVTEISNDAFTDCVNLTSVIFEEGATPITVGYSTAGEDDGLFVESPLEKVVLNREVIYTFPDPDTPAEGLFGNKPALTDITIGDNVKTLSGYMFANAGVTSFNLNKVTTIGNGALMGIKFADITIPASVTNIGDYAFQNCTSLTDLTFADGESDLTIGFQPGTAQYGPFYQSPLTEIIVNRSLVLSEAYADACDSSNEGIFSTEHNMQNTSILLGGQVGKIPEFMFGCLPITSITIPSTVTEISNDAFTDCVNLTSVTFEEGATPITVGYNTAGDDDGLFVESPLEKVVLNREVIYNFPDPDDPTEGLFGGKPALTDITIGDNVKTLSGYMFADAGVTSFNLNKVTTIGNGALMGIKFADITIPATVTSIGDYAFKNCTSLTNLTFADGESDLTIGFQPGTAQYGPFYQSPLTEIIVNRSLVLSESYADACDSSNEGIFSTEHNMQSATISLGGQVGKIPEFMFGCLPLTSITIPATVTEISNDAFTDCINLTSVTFEEGATPITIGYNTAGDDDGLFVESPLEKVVLNREVIYTFPYPDSPTEGLFGGKSSLTSVTLGANVRTVSDYMFAGSGITSIDLKQVTSIGKGAFSGTKLNSIIIPSEVNKIGINAFVDCDDIAEVEIQDGSSILTVGYQDAGGADWGPFYDSPLKKIILGREINYVDGNSNTFTPVEASDGFFANEESGNITDVEVTISNNVRTISNYMFSDLKMNSLTMPSSVTKIGNYAFNGCSTLADLNIPEKVTEIADGTFYDCSSLTSLIIPANVTRIGDNAFYNCSSISDLTIDSSTTPLTFGYQPSDIDEHGPFYQSPLRSIKLDRPIEMTEEYKTYCDQWDEGIFSNNSYNADGDWVTDLVLGPNVKTILKYMFAGTRVQQLHIPETVDEIGVNVVENNKKLNAIIFYDTKVRPDVEHGAFGLNSTGLEMDWENLDPSLEAYPPGKYQYYVFVPLRRGRNFNTLYHSEEELKKYTYWDDLHAIMVDDMPGRYNYYQSHEVDDRHHESRYLDVPGYEWYRKRYYDEENITPPIF